MKCYHNDGDYTVLSAGGLRRFNATSGNNYHYLMDIVKFSIGDWNGPNEIRWVGIGKQFNGTEWKVAVTLSDSMVALTPQSYMTRFIIAQASDVNGATVAPRFRNGQWEVPLVGYKTMYNPDPKVKAQAYSTIAGIMIVIA